MTILEYGEQTSEKMSWQSLLQNSFPETTTDCEKLRWQVQLLIQIADLNNSGKELDDGVRAFANDVENKIVAADPFFLREVFEEPNFLVCSLRAFRRTNCHDASWCLVSSTASLTDERRNLVLKEAMDLDVEGVHSWLKSLNVRGERIILNSHLLPDLLKENTHLRLYSLLKRQEIESLSRGGCSPNLFETYTAIKKFFIDGDDYSESAPPFDAQIENMFSLQHPLHRSLQSLAFQTPNLLLDLVRETKFSEFVGALRSLRNLSPVYLVITDYCYPMGGGESFVDQTCRILSELGFRCIWASFSLKGELHARDAYARTPFFEEVRISGGLNFESVRKIIAEFHPDVIHTHGHMSPFVAPVAAEMRIPTLFGYHFWGSLVRLARPSLNRDILKWIGDHRPIEENLTRKPAYMKSYVASEFVLDVYKKSGGRGDLEIYHPISDPSHYLLSESPDGDKVVQINIARLKGGEILLECIKALSGDIPFHVVQTEPGSVDLDESIQEELEKSESSCYATYGSIKEHFKHARVVLVPSLVDETFCRVAFEAAMNGIPVLSTKSGFLPQMFGETGVYLSADPAEWTATIKELYPDKNRLKKIGQAQKEFLQKKFGLYPLKFVQAVVSLLPSSPRKNLGLFVAWSDQGLGELGRTYARLLCYLGLKTHVFSFQAYSAKDRDVATQHQPKDWVADEFADSVHYSLNDREHVTLYELSQFAKIHNIGKFVQPEVCFLPNWQRLRNLRIANLKLVAVPMIETARASEVLEHNKLDATWFNTLQCRDVLVSRGVTNGFYVGHGFGSRLSPNAVAEKVASTLSRKNLAFCHIGGHNPISRKQTPKVIEAFKEAARNRSDIVLNVCIMGDFAAGIEDSAHPQIRYIFSSLSHDEILEFYRASDVSIQVSSHEGLGLGFYESISVGTPIISLDIPPHNEVVHRGVSGWYLPSQRYIPTDNNEVMVEGGIFAVSDLATCLRNLTRDEVARIIPATAALHASMFSELKMAIRLADAFGKLDRTDEQR